MPRVPVCDRESRFARPAESTGCAGQPRRDDVLRSYQVRSARAQHVQADGREPDSKRRARHGLAGGILAVVALGFSLVWGIMNIINLAHGAFIMLGAYITYQLFTSFHLDPFASIPVSFVLMFAFGYLVQKYVINYVV